MENIVNFKLPVHMKNKHTNPLEKINLQFPHLGVVDHKCIHSLKKNPILNME